MGLPPDLARLGNELVDAAVRTTGARRVRRRRFAVAVCTGAMAFAVLTPAALDPASRELTLAAGSGAYATAGCDHARSAPLVGCEGPTVLHRPYAIN